MKLDAIRRSRPEILDVTTSASIYSSTSVYSGRDMGLFVASPSGWGPGAGFGVQGLGSLFSFITLKPRVE